MICSDEKGSYKVSGGTIQQMIQSGSHTVIDVYTEVLANSDKKVNIYGSNRKTRIQ